MFTDIFNPKFGSRTLFRFLEALSPTVAGVELDNYIEIARLVLYFWHEYGWFQVLADLGFIFPGKIQRGASEHFRRLKLDLSSTKISFLPVIKFLVSRPVFIIVFKKPWNMEQGTNGIVPGKFWMWIILSKFASHIYQHLADTNGELFPRPSKEGNFSVILRNIHPFMFKPFSTVIYVKCPLSYEDHFYTARSVGQKGCVNIQQFSGSGEDA